jgi:biopolymer transport protein ExbB
MVVGDAVSAFMKYVELGGYVMPPLILATLALWFGLGFRISTLRMGRGLEPRIVLRQAEANRLGAPRSALERAALAGTFVRQRGDFNLRARLDDVFGSIVRDLNRYRVLVSTIVGVAPLLGLLGTVSGMVETFRSLGDMTLYSQSGGIAGGISQALLTTQFGLTVAIPGLILRGLLDRRQRVLENQIEELKDLLCTQETKGVRT